MKKSIIFSCLVLISAICFSQSKKDTIFFGNGSIIIGEIKKIKLGVITFDPADANDITVQLRHVRTLSAVSKIYRVETVKQNVYYGKLIQDSSNNYVKMLMGSDTTIIYLQDISNMYPFQKSFVQRFSGKVNLGYSYTRSSNFGRINYDGSIRYASRREEIFLSVSSIYTMSDTSFTRDNENFSSKFNYYFSPSWFGTVFLTYQRNIELGLQRRFQEGFGAGNKFITSKNIYAWARSGLVFNQEKSTENITTGTLTELYGQVEFNFFRFTTPKINIDIAETFFYSLSQRGRFRNDGEANLSWEIIYNFKLNLGFYNNYDSKPPVEGNRNLDFGVTFGLGYKF